VTYENFQYIKLGHNEMRCRLRGGDNQKNIKKYLPSVTAWCATRYVCSEVGVQTSTYAVGHYWHYSWLRPPAVGNGHCETASRLKIDFQDSESKFPHKENLLALTSSGSA